MKQSILITLRKLQMNLPYALGKKNVLVTCHYKRQINIEQL